jgi:hypothetical protein
MSKKREINVGRDFSKHPAGRYREDGPNSGQRFREDFLLPSLKGDAALIVTLDGTRGFGSSFLEEAFGGLVRAGLSGEFLQQRLTVQGRDIGYVSEANQYIQDAADRLAKQSI